MKQKPLKLNRGQRKRLSGLLKKVRFVKEETFECEHITMSQLVEKTPWYQCENPKCRKDTNKLYDTLIQIEQRI